MTNPKDEWWREAPPLIFGGLPLTLFAIALNIPKQPKTVQNKGRISMDY
ncbi:hypothetical protein [Pseudanabaena sp. UWO310]|nr:hypothetical protein [Pseudanabaena sp. UWO310]